MAKVYKYITIHTNNDNLIEFFDSLFNKKAIKEDQYLIYQLDANDIYKDYNLINLVDSIRIDFNEEVKVFESNVLDKDDFKNLFALYKKYGSRAYMNISILSQMLFSDKSEDLNIIRNIVINEIRKDNDFEFIAKAMFKNSLNVSKSANDAYMHRNTVINKLNLMKVRTGLDLQNFKDAFILYLFMSESI